MVRKNVKSPTPRRKGGRSSRNTYRSSSRVTAGLRVLLYHIPVNRRRLFGLLVVWLALGTTPVAPGERDAPVERLERFRSLAAARLGALELSGGEPAREVVGELYALLDDEVLDNLASGSLFASEGFLQERLDALREVC